MVRCLIIQKHITRTPTRQILICTLIKYSHRRIADPARNYTSPMEPYGIGAHTPAQLTFHILHTQSLIVPSTKNEEIRCRKNICTQALHILHRIHVSDLWERNVYYVLQIYVPKVKTPTKKKSDGHLLDP